MQPVAEGGTHEGERDPGGPRRVLDDRPAGLEPAVADRALRRRSGPSGPSCCRSGSPTRAWRRSAPRPAGRIRVSSTSGVSPIPPMPESRVHDPPPSPRPPSPPKRSTIWPAVRSGSIGGTRAVRPGDDLEEVARRVGEVDAAPAVVRVDLAGPAPASDRPSARCRARGSCRRSRRTRPRSRGRRGASAWISSASTKSMTTPFPVSTWAKCPQTSGGSRPSSSARNRADSCLSLRPHDGVVELRFHGIGPYRRRARSARGTGVERACCPNGGRRVAVTPVVR